MLLNYNLLPLCYEQHLPEQIVPAPQKKGTNGTFDKFVHQNTIHNNHCIHNSNLTSIKYISLYIIYIYCYNQKINDT